MDNLQKAFEAARFDVVNANLERAAAAGDVAQATMQGMVPTLEACKKEWAALTATERLMAELGLVAMLRQEEQSYLLRAIGTLLVALPGDEGEQGADQCPDDWGPTDDAMVEELLRMVGAK